MIILQLSYLFFVHPSIFHASSNFIYVVFPVKVPALLIVSLSPLRSQIGDLELEGNEKRERIFKLCSKQKSFFLRGQTKEMKADWFEEIRDAARWVIV